MVKKTDTTCCYCTAAFSLSWPFNGLGKPSLQCDVSRLSRYRCSACEVPLKTASDLAFHWCFAVNKQINDKERVAAAMENPNLREIVEQCVTEPD